MGGMARGPAQGQDHQGLIDEHRIVTLDNDRESLKQKSCFMNIISCCTQLQTKFSEKMKCR